jgi:hypothetical protein
VISYTTDRFWKSYRRLADSVRKQARAAYRQFEKNPYHPSLHFKQVHSSKSIYSVRVNLDYRAVGIRDGEEIVWHWIGPHDEYEKLIGRL